MLRWEPLECNFPIQPLEQESKRNAALSFPRFLRKASPHSVIIVPCWCATVILGVVWDNKEMLPSFSKTSSPFQAHSHPVQNFPLTRSSLVSAGFGPPPVSGTVPSMSNTCKESAGTALRKRFNRPSLPSVPVINKDSRVPRKSSGEPAPLQPPHQHLAQGAQTASLLKHR